ncbi:MAG: hypothetical protein MUF23_08105, partial [Pirellula sp.]|nr:hypothetical protein [Pirellula sp.]
MFRWMVWVGCFAISATPTDYTPPNWEEFVFGVWTPWWMAPSYGDVYFSDVGYYPGPGGMEGAAPLQYSARTDASGNQYLAMTFIASEEPRPYSVLAEARV